MSALGLSHIDDAIAIMRRVRPSNFDMMLYQQPANLFYGGTAPNDFHYVGTEEELHQCGNTACFAGYVAVSPEWKAFGGRCSTIGSPMFIFPEYESRGGEGLGVSESVAFWLQCSRETANALIHGNCIRAHSPNTGLSRQYSLFYGKSFTDVTPEDVIAKLELIKAGSLR